MSDHPQGPGWWLASDGRWYGPALKSKSPDEPSHTDWGLLHDPRPWALGAVVAGWFCLFAVLYLTTMESGADGSTDGCAYETTLGDYQQCARGEETAILNLHSVAAALGAFGMVLAVRGIRRRGLTREFESPSRLAVAAVLAVLLLTTTVSWRVLNSSGVAAHERSFMPLTTGEVIIRIGLGVAIGSFLGLVPLRQRPAARSATSDWKP